MEVCLRFIITSDIPPEYCCYWIPISANPIVSPYVTILVGFRERYRAFTGVK